MSDLTSSVLTGANRSKSRSISPLQQTPYRHASPLTQTSQKRTPAKTGYGDHRFNASNKALTRTFTTSPLAARQKTPVTKFNPSTTYRYSQRSPCLQTHSQADMRKRTTKSPLSQNRYQKFKTNQPSRSPNGYQRSPITARPFGSKPAFGSSAKHLQPSSYGHMRAGVQYQKVQISMGPSYTNAVLRVLNQIDYSVVNEFCRLQQTPTVLHFGNLLCSFLSFTQKHPIDYQDLCWFEICSEVKRTISGSLFEFKEKIKAIVRSREESPLLRKIKQNLVELKQLLRPYVR